VFLKKQVFESQEMRELLSCCAKVGSHTQQGYGSYVTITYTAHQKNRVVSSTANGILEWLYSK
jgi:hypothetical protein